MEALQKRAFRKRDVRNRLLGTPFQVQRELRCRWKVATSDNGVDTLTLMISLQNHSRRQATTKEHILKLRLLLTSSHKVGS